MRLAVLLCVLALLGLGSVQAQKVMDDKEQWDFQLAGRTIVPEVEPNDTCPGQAIVCGDQVDAQLATGTDADWFRIYVEAGTRLTAETNTGSQTPYPNDTKLYIFADDCTTQLAYDDDSGSGYYSLCHYDVTTSGYYNIKVIPYGSTNVGYYYLYVTCPPAPTPPPNDTCDGAIPLERCTQGSLIGYLDLGHNDYTPGIYPSSCTGYGALGIDLVYMADLEVGDVIFCSMSTAAPGPSFDAALYMITDCANPSTTCVIGDDSGDPEEWTYTVTTAGRYYIIADCYSSSTTTGGFTLTWDITCPVTPTGACCVGEVCSITTEEECVALDGVYQGDGVDCAPNTCSNTPSHDASWGEVKSLYR
jgi:hypothetical protein